MVILIPNEQDVITQLSLKDAGLQMDVIKKKTHQNTGKFKFNYARLNYQHHVTITQSMTSSTSYDHMKHRSFQKGTHAKQL